MEDLLAARMEHLHSWLLGLPWVVERPGIAEAPWLRWFAVDCQPLGRRRLWLLTGALDGVATDRMALHVVLPKAAGHRIAAAGQGAVAASVGQEHQLVSLRIDATEVDAEALELLLLVGYEASMK